MLELLLFQYKDMFGEDFPLELFAGEPEIDVINTLYECVSNNKLYETGMQVEARITDAPGLENLER